MALEQIARGDLCPLLNKACVKQECRWYTHLKGRNPQTDEPLDHWGCSIEWLPLLLVENTKESRSVGAVLDQFRNVVVGKAQELLNLANSAQQGRLEDDSER